MTGTSFIHAFHYEPNQVSVAVIVNGASYEPSQVAAESIATIFGTGLTGKTETSSGTFPPWTLTGTTVTIRDSSGLERQIPLYFVSPSQINCEIPRDTGVGTAVVTVVSSRWSVLLAWDPPTADTEGNPVTEPIAYKLYHGASPSEYFASIDVGSVTTWKVEDLYPGTHYFAVTAYTRGGSESGFSNEVNKTQGKNVASGTVQIKAVGPGLFSASGTGKGVASANLFRLKADRSWAYEPVAQYDSVQQAYVPVPIDLGDETDQVFLILYGTGIRHTSGQAAARVTLGGVPGNVTYAGPQGFYPGLDQVNVLLPRNLTGQGKTDVILTVDGVPANTVEVAIR